MPRIQLEHHVAFGGQGYGVLKMPDEWVTMATWLSENEAGRTDELFSSMFSHNDLVQYGWRLVDHTGQLTYIEGNTNNNSFGYFGSSDYDQMILPLHEGEVEFGK